MILSKIAFPCALKGPFVRSAFLSGSQHPRLSVSAPSVLSPSQRFSILYHKKALLSRVFLNFLGHEKSRPQGRDSLSFAVNELFQNVNFHFLCAKSITFLIGVKEKVNQNPPIHQSRSGVRRNGVTVGKRTVSCLDVKLVP